MNERIELAKQAGHTDWVMRITADRRIEVNESVEVTETAQKVLDALQNLLKPAQPEQEPVAIVHVRPLMGNESIPQTRIEWKNGRPVAGPLYTTPPQRKPLTENAIKHLWYEACQTNLELTSQLIVHLARNIEAAHGIQENNNGAT